MQDNGQVVVNPTETAVQPAQTASPAQTGQEIKPQEVKAPDFDSEGFNKFFERDEKNKFKSVDHLKDVFGRYDQYKDLEAVRKQLKESQDEFELSKKEVEELYEKASPKTIFGSDENYKKFLIKQAVNKDGNLNNSIIDEVLSKDINSFDDLQVIAKHSMLENPDWTIEEAIADAVDKIGVNKTKLEGGKFDNISDFKNLLEPLESAKLKRLAKEARNKFISIKNTEVQSSGEYTSWQTKQESMRKLKEENVNKLKESWNSVSDSFNDLTTIKYTEKDKEGNDIPFFEFPMDKGTVEKLKESILEYVIPRGLNATPENIQKVKNEFIERYAGMYRNEIAKAIRTETETKLKEQFIAERENRQPFSTKTNQSVPTPDFAKGNIERLRKAGVIR